MSLLMVKGILQYITKKNKAEDADIISPLWLKCQTKTICEFMSLFAKNAGSVQNRQARRSTPPATLFYFMKKKHTHRHKDESHHLDHAYSKLTLKTSSWVKSYHALQIHFLSEMSHNSQRRICPWASSASRQTTLIEWQEKPCLPPARLVPALIHCGQLSWPCQFMEKEGHCSKCSSPAQDGVSCSHRV